MVDLAPMHVPAETPTRTAGTRHGVLLVSMSSLSVLGAVLLAPVLPAVQETFEDTPGVTVLVPVMLTIPALMIALLAPFAGSIVDRLGRKRLLVGSLVVYAVLGTAPLLLSSLPAIVATRAGVGIAEAAIMTCCTTLIVDYYQGAARNRWLGMQTVFAALAATVFFALGGALGSVSWRAPFWLYSVSLVFAVLAAVMIWQPVKPAAAADRVLPPFPWRVLLVPVLVTLFAGVVFYTPIVELSFVLVEAGVTSPAAIGAVGALSSLATAAGGLAFPRVVDRRGTRTALLVAFALAGSGLVVFAVSDSVPVLVAGVVVACLGTGLLLPTLLTWAVGSLTFDERGRGTGLWTSSLFIGNFICPLLVLALSGLLGGLSAAIVVIGVVSLAMVPVSRLVVRGA